MFIELFFATALDMSLPEFQPQEDISGNVIVSSIDEETNEIIVEEVPFEEISINVSSDLPLQGLSLEEDLTENEIFLRSNDSRSIDYITPSTQAKTHIYSENGGDVSGDEPGGDVSGDEPGGDVSGNGGSVNIDLTNVESKLDNVIILQRSILMVMLVSFLFPIIKSCVNLLKGGKDV